MTLFGLPSSSSFSSLASSSSLTSWRYLKRYPKTIAATYLFISPSQFRVISTIPHISATLSVLGSLAILYRILRYDRFDVDTACYRRTYHRLLVAMSVCDVIASMAFAFGTLPVPAETKLHGAHGTTATCTAQGLLIHVFVICVLFYNTGLMIYFVLTIRYGWTDSKVAKYVEPFIHVWALFVPMAEGIAGLFLHIYNPIGFGAYCGVSPYPLLCGVFDACERGRSAKLLYTIFSTVPESTLIVLIYVSIVAIYCTVRAQDRRALAISGNRDSVHARTRAVAVQSWLFAAIFFNTWVYAVLSPILQVTVPVGPILVKSQYVLSILIVIFLPLQGFFNFCIYIRPRFVRLRRDDQLSFWLALKLAAFGGRETINGGGGPRGQRRRRSSLLDARKRRSSTMSLVSTTRQEYQLSNISMDLTTPTKASPLADNTKNDNSPRQQQQSRDVVAIPIREPDDHDLAETTTKATNQGVSDDDKADPDHVSATVDDLIPPHDVPQEEIQEEQPQPPHDDHSNEDTTSTTATTHDESWSNDKPDL